MEHLPKYKAAGPLGDWYEHYVHMPSDYVKELIFNALNGNLPPAVVHVWQSALMLAVDKGQLHKEGPFKGQKALWLVVISMALRRIAERVPAAQLRSRWASLFSRYRQFGVTSRKAGEYAIMVFRYGELRPRIQHSVAVHEVSGGLRSKASCQLSEVLDIAKELKVSINYWEEGPEHTWTVNDFATKWVQRMSFTVVKFCAMTVLVGL